MSDLRRFVDETLRAVDAGLLDEVGAAGELGKRLCREVACERASICSLHGARVVRLGGFDAGLGVALTPDVELSDQSPTAHRVANRLMGVYPPIGPDSHDWPPALRERYLAPQGLQSLIVAAIGHAPDVSGFVCAGSVAERRWSLADMARLRVVANAISLRRARLREDDRSQEMLAPGGGRR